MPVEIIVFLQEHVKSKQNKKTVETKAVLVGMQCQFYNELIMFSHRRRQISVKPYSLTVTPDNDKSSSRNTTSVPRAQNSSLNLVLILSLIPTDT